MSKEKPWPGVIASDMKCMFCAKSGVILKYEAQSFSSPLCVDHMLPMLQSWKKQEDEQAKLEAQRKEREKAEKKAAKEQAKEQPQNKETNGAAAPVASR